jgi:hypothetical protein
MLARLHWQAGDHEAATRRAARAESLFGRLGDARGRAALRRLLPSVPTGQSDC